MRKTLLVFKCATDSWTLKYNWQQCTMLKLKFTNETRGEQKEHYGLIFRAPCT